MNTIEMNNDHRYDVDLSKAKIKIEDTNLFSTKEKSSVKALNKVLSTTVELKACDKALYNLFIEFDCTKMNGITSPSGIATTEAGIWRINVGEIVFEFPTEFLRWLYTNRNLLKIEESKLKNRTDTDVTGILVPVADILPLYNRYSLEKRLKELGIR